MKAKQLMVWTMFMLLSVSYTRAQNNINLDLGTRCVGVPPVATTVTSSAEWMQNPLDVNLEVAVTNLYAASTDYMEIDLAGQRLKFYGAGTDAFGNYMVTNYAPVVIKAVLRRDYALSIVCPNSGPSGSPLFQVYALDPNIFLPLLTNASPDPVSAFLWSHFTSSGQYAITNVSATYDIQATNLALECNRIITTMTLYDSTRFAGVALSTPTTALLATSPTGQQLVMLNRMLMQDAYGLSAGSADNSGTAELTFFVQPPPELKLKRFQPDPHYSVIITPDTGMGSNLDLQHPTTGYVSTNYSTIQIVKDKFGRIGTGDGCDDATKAPGQGTWLTMGPGCNADSNRIALSWSASLGRTFDGLAAGQLAFRELGLSRNSYTPYAIFYNAASTNFYQELPLTTTNNPYVVTNLYSSVIIVTTNIPYLVTNSAGGITTNQDNLIRQVKSTQTFVDIVQPDTNQTVLNFYLPSQVGTNQNIIGLFTNIIGTPFVSWTIQNPESSTTNKLNIIENRHGICSTNTLVRSISSGLTTWTLTQGAGASTRIESRRVSFAGTPATNRVELDSISSTNTSLPVYQCEETYNFYPWGSELVKTRIPNSPDLITTYAFYNNDDPTNDPYNFGYGQLKQTIYPDGYWEKRLYYSAYYSTLIPLVVMTPYIDSADGGGALTPDDADYSNCSVTQYFYFDTGHEAFVLNHGTSFDDSSVFSEDNDATGYGILTSEGEPIRADVNDLNNTEAVFVPSQNIQTIFKDAASPGVSGHVSSVVTTPLTFDAYYYDHGVFDTNANQFTLNPTNHIYSWAGVTNKYPDHRQTHIRWREGWDFYNGDIDSLYMPPSLEDHQTDPYVDHMFEVNLVVNMSTNESDIYHGGSLAQTETYFCSDVATPAWTPISSIRYYTDSLGRATNIVLTDSVSGQKRTLYTADYQGGGGYDGELLFSETDQYGQTTSYTYDKLKRLGTETFVGHGSLPDKVMHFNYDANERTLSQNLTASTLSSNQSWGFDLAGRLTNYIDPSGVVVITTYSSDCRTTTNIAPGGITTIKANYLDRTSQSVTGNSVVSQFFAHTISLGYGAIDEFEHEQLTFLGASNSPRWSVMGTDELGNNDAWQQRPVGTGTTNTIWLRRYYIGKDVWHDVTSGGFPATNYCYDMMGRNSYRSVGTNLNDATIGASGSYGDTHCQCSWSPQSYIILGGNVYLATTNYSYLADGANNLTLASISLKQLNGFDSNTMATDIYYDADTNVTVTRTLVDRADNEISTITSSPGTSTLSATNITQNGLLMQSSSLSVSNPTVYYYDPLGRTNQIKNSVGFSAFTTYDPSQGWVISTTDEVGVTTSYAYYGVAEANAGQVKSKTDAGGKTTYFSYTTRNELFRTWGDVPYPAEYHYSQYGNMTNLMTFQGGSGWNAATWPTNTTGPTNNTFWNYDELSGNLLEKIDAMGHKTTYAYDDVTGRLVTRSWERTIGGNHVMVTNSYNGYGNLAQQDYNDGTTTVIYTNFNRTGQPRKVIDATGTNLLVYDNAIRLIYATNIGGLLKGVAISNHFNASLGRDSLSIYDTSTNLKYSYGYDAYGRLSGVTNDGYSASYDYQPHSDLLQNIYCANNSTNILTISRQWENGTRLTSVENIVNGISISSFYYIYDNLNRRTGIWLENGCYWQYSYDDRNELTSANKHWSDFRPVSGQQYGYGFDSVGNRKSATFGGDISGGNLRTNIYAVNNLNQYTSIATPSYYEIVGAALATNSVTVNGMATDRKGEYFHVELPVTNAIGPIWQDVRTISTGVTNAGGLVLAANAQIVSYDADGNVTYDGLWNYQWDAENRLMSMDMTNALGIDNANRYQLAFAYDYMGRRVKKVLLTWNGSVFVAKATNCYIYDGWNVLAMVDSTGGLVESFVWGSDISGSVGQAGGVGGLLLTRTYVYGLQNTNTFAGYDGNGNVTVLINASDKSIAGRYEYSPFGETIRATGPMAKQNPFRFSTKYCDDESGLFYFGYRYYSPMLGRWINRDPTEEQGGLALYLFVNNGPIGDFDITGQGPFTQMVVKYLAVAITSWKLFAGGDHAPPNILKAMQENREATEKANRIGASRGRRNRGGQGGPDPEDGSIGAGGLAAGIAFSVGLTWAESMYRSVAALGNLAAGQRSEDGTTGFEIESMIIHKTNGDDALADLDAISAALDETGGAAADTLTAWATFEDVGDAVVNSGISF